MGFNALQEDKATLLLPMMINIIEQLTELLRRFTHNPSSSTPTSSAPISLCFCCGLQISKIALKDPRR